MMPSLRLFVFAALCLSFASTASAAGPVCPPGTNAGTCLNNAIAAIEQLEQRVAKLEAERGQSGGGAPAPTGQGAGNIHSQAPPSCKGGQVLDVKTDRCVCQNNWVWDGANCRPKNAP